MPTSHQLTDHFFRNEYGKMVSVITRYLGAGQIETAEDIVQETLLKATDHWEKNGIPPNPQAWLYTTAKNLTFNIHKRQKHAHNFRSHLKDEKQISELDFSEEIISDSQLKMMFICANAAISEQTQIALILKVLCGFSIAEISNAYFSTNETINKRLVRGRKQLREMNLSMDLPVHFEEQISIILKTISLMYNEGYNPAQKNQTIRYDLCLESIRLAELLASHSIIVDKSNVYSLLALMYLNASRFQARSNVVGDLIEMKDQNRSLWNQKMIRHGLDYLHQATQSDKISKYLILATISANHCTASTYESTNWTEILSLYDALKKLDPSAIVKMNRCVVVAEVKGNQQAILELLELANHSDIENYYLFHSTLGELYAREDRPKEAKKSLEKAILLCLNDRDKKFLEQKLMAIVPIPSSRL